MRLAFGFRGWYSTGNGAGLLVMEYIPGATLADEPALATDVAELLVSIARIVGGERTLASALAGLGSDVVDLALEQDDRSRFSMPTRDGLRSDPAPWDDLRRRVRKGRPTRSDPASADPGPSGSAPTTEEQ